MKIGVAICLAIAVIWAIVALLQLWFGIMSAEIFMKVSITAGVVAGTVLVVSLAVREYISEREMKAKGFIDS